jgi:hypothetical protein
MRAMKHDNIRRRFHEHLNERAELAHAAGEVLRNGPPFYTRADQKCGPAPYAACFSTQKTKATARVGEGNSWAW